METNRPTAPSLPMLSMSNLHSPDEPPPFTAAQTNESTTAIMPAPRPHSMAISSHTLIPEDMNSMSMDMPTNGMEDAPFFSENYFTTQNPATRGLRMTYIKILGILSAVLLVYMMGVLSIYWGALYSSPQQAHKLDAWIIDSDGGIVGQAITQAFLNFTGPSTSLNYVVAQPARTDPAALEDYLVNQERAWLIIQINAGASANLTAAAQSADATYNGSLAVTLYGDEARNEDAYDTVILPQAQGILQQTVEQFAAQYVAQLPGQGVNVTALAAQAPSILTLPIGFTERNLRPFDVPVATAVEFVGLIYLLVISFILSLIHWGARVEATHLEDHLSFTSLIAARIVNPFIIYFFMTLFYALISRGFQAPFSRFYGPAGFLIYWMMCWMGMSALGFATESVITLTTPRLIPFFLLIWIISNVSTALLPIDLLPGFYRYGYAMPFYNVSRTVRALIFGTRNQIGLNFGVQFAWIGVSIIGIVIFQWRRFTAAKAARDKMLAMGKVV
ncbi:unnamed protein product [Peniophora sp. CBMAI 1063]|nr:unnamed protein product [Peniophora sp. CBMAI 1063]